MTLAIAININLPEIEERILSRTLENAYWNGIDLNKVYEELGAEGYWRWVRGSNLSRFNEQTIRNWMAFAQRVDSQTLEAHPEVSLTAWYELTKPSLPAQVTETAIASIANGNKPTTRTAARALVQDITTARSLDMLDRAQQDYPGLSDWIYPVLAKYWGFARGEARMSCEEAMSLLSHFGEVLPKAKGEGFAFKVKIGPQIKVLTFETKRRQSIYAGHIAWDWWWEHQSTLMAIAKTGTYTPQNFLPLTKTHSSIINITVKDPNSLGDAHDDEGEASASSPGSDRSSALLSSESVEWYTPPEFFVPMRQIAPIGLDVASNSTAQQWIQAERWYGLKDNGFIQSFRVEGRKIVYGNFPYGPKKRDYYGPGLHNYGAGAWIERMIQAFDQGDFWMGIIVARGDSDAVHILERRFLSLHPDERMAFISPDHPDAKSPKPGTVVWCLSAPQEWALFAEAYESWGSFRVPFNY